MLMKNMKNQENFLKYNGEYIMTCVVVSFLNLRRIMQDPIMFILFRYKRFHTGIISDIWNVHFKGKLTNRDNVFSCDFCLL